jgi:ABC-type nitrate/sulfonate/bicarbonate transport system permease component
MAENLSPEKIEALASGKMAEDIKNNMKYVVTGMALGGVIGVLAAGFLGKSKIIFGLGGAMLFGASGYLMGNKKSDTTK